MAELNKLPGLLAVNAPTDLLAAYGRTIPGMNMPQVYIKVPHCRTTGHQENNSFCAVNINVGPGECEWFAVPHTHWTAMDSLCERCVHAHAHGQGISWRRRPLTPRWGASGARDGIGRDRYGVDSAKGSWWPRLADLEAAQVPYCRFVQQPGDAVFVSYGTVHWVQSLGATNNVAWNVGPRTGLQFRHAIERYYWNAIRGTSGAFGLAPRHLAHAPGAHACGGRGHGPGRGMAAQGTNRSCR